MHTTISSPLLLIIFWIFDSSTSVKVAMAVAVFMLEGFIDDKIQLWVSPVVTFTGTLLENVPVVLNGKGNVKNFFS
jgi:hypothetical protein